MTSPSGVLPGWYPDPDDRISERYWDGQYWRDRRARYSNGVITGALVVMLLAGCATVATSAPTCHPHSPVSTPSSTPFGVTLLLWAVGVGLMVALSGLWVRHGWSPRALPVLFVVGAVLIAPIGWFLAAASCGL
jgi:hypothetical protein